MTREILQMIGRHDGTWTWYQLERALSNRDEVKAGRLIAILGELERDGFIVSVKLPEFPQPVYRLTDKGLDSLQAK